MVRRVTPLAVRVAPAGLEHTDKERWLKLRGEGIGGSDIAAVMGLAGTGRYAHSPWSLYLEKTGNLPAVDDDRDDRDDELAWFGHEMEVVAARRFRMTHPGTRLHRTGMLARADAPWMRVNLDRRVTGCPDGPCLWECKNRNAYAARDWEADAEGEGLPDGPVLQTHWGLIVTGYSHGHLSVVIGGNELRSFRVDASETLHKTITEEAGWFWNDCVLAGREPPIDSSERTGKILARLWDTDPSKVLTAPAEMAGRHKRIHDGSVRVKAAEARRDLLVNELKAWMGDAEMIVDGDGNKLATWKNNGTFREKAFRAEVDPKTVRRYSRTVREVDLDKLKTGDPALYARYRARTFRLSAIPE